MNCFTSFTFLLSFVSVLHFFDPLSAFVFYRGVSSKSYNGFYIVLLAPRVLLWLQQSLRFGELMVTPLSRGKTNCYRTLWRFDLNLIIMTINLYDRNFADSFKFALLWRRVIWSKMCLWLMNYKIREHVNLCTCSLFCVLNYWLLLLCCFFPQ